MWRVSSCRVPSCLSMELSWPDSQPRSDLRRRETFYFRVNQEKVEVSECGTGPIGF